MTATAHVRKRKGNGMSEERFAELAALGENWDSYGAPAVSREAIQRAKDWLAAVAIVPLSDGGIQLEWHRDGVEFEIAFSVDGTVEALLASQVRQPT